MNHGQAAWKAYQAVRTRRPLIHTITDFVAMELTAATIRAVGATPVMAHAVEEAAELAMHADALVLDLGTLSEDWLGGMRAAIDQARHRGMPVVLDPDGAGITTYRTDVALRLAPFATVVRGSSSELRAMAARAAGRRVNPHADRNEATQQAAAEVAQRFDTVVMVTGAVDRVTDGRRTLLVSNGHRLLPRVAGIGGALSGLVGACLAVEPEPLGAAAHACALFALAGELAGQTAAGPGSLRVGLLDQIYALSEAAVVDGLRVDKA